MSIPKIAFICVHNSCRSQIAEALGKFYFKDIFESFSAGTEVKKNINPDATRLIKMIYGIDMETTQYSKLLSELPKVDAVITMGCNVACPLLPCKYYEDWGLEDPSGKSDADFIMIINIIDEKIKNFAQRLKVMLYNDQISK